MRQIILFAFSLIFSVNFIFGQTFTEPSPKLIEPELIDPIEPIDPGDGGTTTCSIDKVLRDGDAGTTIEAHETETFRAVTNPSGCFEVMNTDWHISIDYGLYINIANNIDRVVIDFNDYNLQGGERIRIRATLDGVSRYYSFTIPIECDSSPSISVSGDLCAGNQITLSLLNASQSYTWDLPSGFLVPMGESLTSKTITVTPTEVGNYTITAINSESTCTSPSKSISISSGVSSASLVSPVSLVCIPDNPTQTFQLDINGSYTGIEWYIDPVGQGSLIPDYTDVESINYTFTQAGDYSLSARIIGCGDDVYVNHTVTVEKPEILSCDNCNIDVCQGQTIEINLSTSTGTDILWENFYDENGQFVQLPDNVVLSEPNLNNTSVKLTFNSSGTKEFTLRPQGNGCVGSDYKFKIIVPEENAATEVSFIPSDVSSKSMYVNSCYQRTSVCGRTYDEIVLFGKLNTGDMHNWGNAAFSATANFTAKFNFENSSISDQNISLNIDNTKPEQIYYFTLDAATYDLDDLRSISIEPNGSPWFTSTIDPADIDDVNIEFYIEPKYSIDVKNALVGVKPSNASTQWEHSFELYNNNPNDCYEIPYYHLQIVRKYAEETSPNWENATNYFIAVEGENTEANPTIAQLSLAEGSGSYYWRVRALGSDLDGTISHDAQKMSAWSNGDVITHTDPDQDLNWIYSRFFTEQGKVKEQVTYADGLSRVRQQQTRLNNRVVGTESYYDHLGRNNANSLPIPMADNQNYLGYKESGILRENTGAQEPSPLTGHNLKMGDALSINSYYESTLLDGEGNPLNAEVPKAEGRPYSQTIFRNEPESRPYIQAGVGREHKVGETIIYDEVTGEEIRKFGDKVIKTYYLNAQADELIKVFGKDAPNAENVTKQVTFDANGVASVSYTDKAGRTIATALSYTDINSMDQLNVPLETVQKSLEARSYQTGPGEFKVVNNVFVTEEVSGVEFTYSFSIPANNGNTTSSFDCNSICTDCDYYLELALYQEGDPLFSDKTTSEGDFADRSEIFKVFTEKPIKVTAANNNGQCSIVLDGETLTGTAPTLKPGVNYTLVKTIKTRNIGYKEITDPNTGVITYEKNTETDLELFKKKQIKAFDARVSRLRDDVETTSDLSSLANENNIVTLATSVSEVDPTPINCESISFELPASDCLDEPLEKASQEYEAYFNSELEGISSITYYKYNPAYSDIEREVAKISAGDLDQMVRNLLIDYPQLSNDEVWSAWEGLVTQIKVSSANPPDTDPKKDEKTYHIPDNEVIDEDIDLTIEEQPILDRFLNILEGEMSSKVSGVMDVNCDESTESEELWKTAFFDKIYYYGKLEGITKSSDPQNYYQYVYFNEGIKEHEDLLNQLVGNPLGTIPLLQSYFNQLSFCDRQALKLGQGGTLSDEVKNILKDPQYFETNIKSECYELCQSRAVEFRDKIAHEILSTNSGATFEGYRVIKTELVQGDQGNETTYFQYSLQEEPGLIITDPTISKCELDNMVEGLVSKCQEGYCDQININTTDAGQFNFDIGTLQKVMHANIDVKVNYGSLLSGYKEVSFDQGNLFEFRFIENLYPLLDVEQSVVLNGKAYLLGRARDGFTYNGTTFNDEQASYFKFLAIFSHENGIEKFIKINDASNDPNWKLEIENENSIYLFYFNRSSARIVNEYDQNLNFINSKPLNGSAYASEATFNHTNGNWVVTYLNNINGSSQYKMDIDKYTNELDFISNINKVGDYSGFDKSLGKWFNLYYDGYTNEFYFRFTKGDALPPSFLTNNESALVRLNSDFEVINIHYEPLILGTSFKISPNTIFGLETKSGISGRFLTRRNKNYLSKELEVPLNTSYYYFNFDELGNIVLANDNLIKVFSTDFSDIIEYDLRHVETTHGYREVTGAIFGENYTYVFNDDGNQELTIGHGGIDKYSNSEPCYFNQAYHLQFKFTDIPTSPTYDEIPDELKDYVYHPTVEPCEDQQRQKVLSAFDESFRILRAEKIKAIEESYKQACEIPDFWEESIKYKYDEAIYHYTLYYYDRAGNLVKTVPPAGVKTLDVSDGGIEASKLADPNHTMETHYRYNSLGQLVWQSTPDGGVTNFYYNDLGLLRFSINAKQRQEGKFSYTKYDALGRVIEVGQSNGNDSDFESVINQVGESSFPTTETGLEQRTITKYTQAHPTEDWLNNHTQTHLRNRVSYTMYDADGDLSEQSTDDQSISVFSYDIHGNVNRLIQKLPGLGRGFVIEYEYDLISGNVTEVAYNRGKEDAFFHRYEYDADNRIVKVETSPNGILWDTDAEYEYYAHGPLKRTILGEDHVQGVDYTYTIHGWLKSINDHDLNPSEDPGKDGTLGGLTAKDAFAMTLNYYSGDYKNVDPANDINNQLNAETGKDLFNGNISAWATNVDGNLTGSGLMGFQYSYDVLNRIKSSNRFTHNGFDWNGVDNFATSYTYDGNGNLQTLTRQGGSSSLIDDFRYHYDKNEEGELINRLNHVVDYAGAVGKDMGSQGVNNYQYDEIGNLVRDNISGVDQINWNISGKVSTVQKTNGAKTEFEYDALGNRVVKRLINPDNSQIVTYYVRDASGNVMSTYEQNITTNGTNDYFRQQETPIYGSERLGMVEPLIEIDPNINTITNELSGEVSRVLGLKGYELKDHLGNVRTVISDKKVGDITTGFTADIKRISNYYPFGADMPDLVDQTNDYRYGFNGKERDDSGEWDGAFPVVFKDDALKLGLHLDDGKVEDYSGSGLTGTKYGAVSTTQDRFGIENKALLFTGTNDYVVIPDSKDDVAFIHNTGIFTISIWVKVDEETGRYMFMRNQSSTSNRGFNFMYETNTTYGDKQLRFTITNGTGSQRTIALGSTGTLNAGKWHHVVVSGDGTSIRFYVDGQPDGSNTPIKGLASGIAYTNLKLSDPNTSIKMAGGMDEIQIYNRTLTEQEIVDLYNGIQPGTNQPDMAGEVQELTNYDYGFRIYNPSIAKFLSVDPLAPDFPFYTPYQFASNMPILAIDIDGLESSENLNYNEGGKSKAQIVAPPPVAPPPVLVLPRPPASGSNQKRNYHILGDSFWGMGDFFRQFIIAYTPTWIDKQKEIDKQEFDYLERKIANGDYIADNEVDRYLELVEEFGVPIHGNSKKSKKPQIIYKIFIKETGQILKFGISGRGEVRPKEQLKKLSLDYGTEVDYEVIDRAYDNETARDLEQEYVDEYFEEHNRRPAEQRRPQATQEGELGHRPPTWF
ncbi:LamG-like jellyroll fold domain-containing protein [Mangrovivirga cuniculi]|uniref:LamG-like jellyroll fold domain-containing protein n=1 Tax=Mangrovivirga cuniculi TaxID=2715131 RepID=A0A4D7JGF4_9BACT|nr:LamG-like jellyroll fold domain-containing protein [Mangrovivirga cuniculi]QCK13777.1 hypothetical protein DCC35_02890 [Mangrovivirga cuniculi]